MARAKGGWAEEGGGKGAIAEGRPAREKKGAWGERGEEEGVGRETSCGI
jgi:hypothetical protein